MLGVVLASFYQIFYKGDQIFYKGDHIFYKGDRSYVYEGDHIGCTS